MPSRQESTRECRSFHGYKKAFFSTPSSERPSQQKETPGECGARIAKESLEELRQQLTRG